jgi:UDP-glucose 4-epimerase|tara:strand:+ start:11243 stop:12181 length:939 start_codon:yes stop_codon:yes gene_type:complete
MTVLITGANGFIGRHLIKKLSKYRSAFGEVITVSRKHFKSPYSDRHYRCDLGFSDITEPDFSCLKFIYSRHEPSCVFHLASKATVKMKGNDPFNIIQDNILSTQKICQWAPKGAKVVLASSVIVYGDWGDLYIEEDKTEPTSIYGMTKRASESILNYYTSTGAIKGVSARMCATVGRGLTHGVVYDFIRKIKNNPVLEALGNCPGSTKPYCHIDDVTDALVLLALKEDVDKYYNVMPNDLINIEQVAKAVMFGMGIEKDITWLGDEANWSGDNKLISALNSKLKSIGWQNKHNSKQSIIKSVQEILEKETNG